jgi:8-hydroxy-5-deazaflavin:NADPH oxidoreductase
VKITAIGRGPVGAGLARLWRVAGHEVTELGRDGGDASDADVLLVAVPSDRIGDALRKVNGIQGKSAIDATNAYAGRSDGYPSLAAEVKSLTGGPVSKAFNINFAEIYGQIADQRVPPSCLYCADEAARQVTEQLIRDAGYDPVSTGALDQARALEDQLGLLFAISNAGLGPFFYRVARPGQL